MKFLFTLLCIIFSASIFSQELHTFDEVNNNPKLIESDLKVLYANLPNLRKKVNEPTPYLRKTLKEILNCEIPNDIKDDYLLQKAFGHNLDEPFLNTLNVIETKRLTLLLKDLKEKSNYYLKLEEWLSTNSCKGHNYLNDFLNNLDSFNLNEYIKAIHFDEMKIPFESRKKQ